MITAYHRPTTLEEALALIDRASPRTVPLGGGTLLAHTKMEALEVVDLQALGLDGITVQGKNLEIGATATLQKLLEHPSCTDAMKPAIKLEAPLNLRNAATVAGTLVTCDGRSTFTTVLLAFQSQLKWVPFGKDSGAAAQSENLGDYLPLRPAGLIIQVVIPMQARLAFEQVARTPSDKPIVCVAVAQWPSGRTRMAVGGFGAAPRLAMAGTEAEGLVAAARNACHDAGDEWGSAEYRMDVAATLAKRCLAAISGL